MTENTSGASGSTIPVLGTKALERASGGLGGTTLLSPGEILDGHYEILSSLGSGGMAQVYLAHDRWLQRRVAIKVTINELAEHLAREAQVLAGFHHPGLVSAYAYGRHKQMHYLVLEYLEGASLSQRLRTRANPNEPAFSIDEALSLVVGICDALMPMHERGMVHCDLKPGNIMCTPDRVVLIDLGLVWDTRNQVSAVPFSGSPPFMAPEIIDGSVRVERATRIDIYALGMILFSLLAGSPPFDDRDPRVVMGMQLRNEAASLATRRDDLPPQLSSIVGLLIARDAERRPRDIESVRDALLGIPRRGPTKRVTQ